MWSPQLLKKLINEFYLKLRIFLEETKVFNYDKEYSFN